MMNFKLNMPLVWNVPLNQQNDEYLVYDHEPHVTHIHSKIGHTEIDICACA